jgi:hypothetical protein
MEGVLEKLHNATLYDKYTHSQIIYYLNLIITIAEGLLYEQLVPRKCK